MIHLGPILDNTPLMMVLVWVIGILAGDTIRSSGKARIIGLVWSLFMATAIAIAVWNK